MGHEPKVSLGANLVRTTSDNGHRFQPRRFLIRAILGLMQCKQIASYSITSSARARSEVDLRTERRAVHLLKEILGSYGCLSKFESTFTMALFRSPFFETSVMAKCFA
jgi:hypothetical protein